MKLSTILMVVFTLNLSATGFGQFSFTSEGKKIRDVFQIIENESNYRFFYNDDFKSVDNIVDLKADNNSINQVLDKLFDSTDFAYQIFDNNLIVVSLKENFQQGIVKGTVTDEKGNPLPGVSVVVKGTTNGTLTDATGKYIIDNAPKNATLIFSFVGKATQEISSNGRMLIDVVLKELAIGLDEVVVIGYGSMKKRDLTGSVSQVRTEELEAVPAYNMEHALKSQAAGIQVTQNSGEPGGRIEVRIRGGNSMIGSNQPLYVVDGFSITGGIDFLNPSDIESINILKDASATAI